jgi:ABC-type lipoprotein export system ATPase subunit
LESFWQSIESAPNPGENDLADWLAGEFDSKTAKEIIAPLFDICRTQKKTVLMATRDEKVVEAADAVYTSQDGKLELRD